MTKDQELWKRKRMAAFSRKLNKVIGLHLTACGHDREVYIALQEQERLYWDVRGALEDALDGRIK